MRSEQSTTELRKRRSHQSSDDAGWVVAAGREGTGLSGAGEPHQLSRGALRARKHMKQIHLTVKAHYFLQIMYVFFLQSNNYGNVELVYRLPWRWLFLHQLPVRVHDHLISQVSSVCGIWATHVTLQTVCGLWSGRVFTHNLHSQSKRIYLSWEMNEQHNSVPLPQVGHGLTLLSTD